LIDERCKLVANRQVVEALCGFCACTEPLTRRVDAHPNQGAPDGRLEGRRVTGRAVGPDADTDIASSRSEDTCMLLGMVGSFV
jgi:hypothetical protein